MNEEIKKWRCVKKELTARNIGFIEPDSEDLPDYGHDTAHALVFNTGEDDVYGDEDLVFALREIERSYFIRYGDGLLESGDDKEVSVKEMVDFVVKEKKAWPRPATQQNDLGFKNQR